jgi:hypothetical protein
VTRPVATTCTTLDERSTAPTWCIALRQLEFARRLQTERIAPDEAEDLAAKQAPA